MTGRREVGDEEGRFHIRRVKGVLGLAGMPSSSSSPTSLLPSSTSFSFLSSSSLSPSDVSTLVNPFSWLNTPLSMSESGGRLSWPTGSPQLAAWGTSKLTTPSPSQARLSRSQSAELQRDLLF